MIWVMATLAGLSSQGDKNSLEVEDIHRKAGCSAIQKFSVHFGFESNELSLAVFKC